ncbi:MAG: hypothetical protein Q7S28_00280 [bacterium]|nr:hypothetical protein [bacterium]
MWETFGRNIKEYNELAKDELHLLGKTDETSQRELDQLQKNIEWRVRKGAEIRRSEGNAQHDVYELQKEKQDIFSRLENDIAGLNDTEHVIEWGKNARPVRMEDGKLHSETTEGGSPLSIGELMTDAEWGIKYELPDTLPRNLRKRYLIERAKTEMRQLLDDQIIIDEIASKTISPGLRRAYQEKQKQSLETGMIPEGIIAEKMVENFFRKLSFDFDVDFRVVSADVSQDVTQKIDFIIHRKSHTRGVGVENTEKENVAVQFTTTTRKEALEHKNDQIQRAKQFFKRYNAPVDDLVLVSVPLSQTRSLYNSWKKYKFAGGPDKLWSEAIKEQVFKEVLKDILTKEEIAQEWALVSKRGEEPAEKLAA